MRREGHALGARIPKAKARQRAAGHLHVVTLDRDH
jgi:hypothetical protein